MIAVCITTYNHEAYIARCIESVLAQQCDEPLRIYIGDDASTDGTEAICRHYAAQDERIVYIRCEHNKGLVDNTIDLYHRMMTDSCEYIAMLDGDDYWTDAYKLQKQVDFLRAHPDYGFVHTAAYDDVNGQLVQTPPYYPIPTGDIHLRYNRDGAMHTNCTVLFRTELLKSNELEAIRTQHFLVLDYPLYGLFAQRTLFGYLEDYTAAWRKHVSTSHPTSIQQFLRYQYHYARAWRWLDRQYRGVFHFNWLRASGWYAWQVFYSIVHSIKGYFTKK